MASSVELLPKVEVSDFRYADSSSGSEGSPRKSSSTADYEDRPSMFTFTEPMAAYQRVVQYWPLSALAKSSKPKRNNVLQLAIALGTALVLCWGYLYLPRLSPTSVQQNSSDTETGESLSIPPHASLRDDNKENRYDDMCTTWPADPAAPYEPAQSKYDKLQLDSVAPLEGWRKPDGIKIVIVIFAGRRQPMDILDCYLQQNLVSNGGYVDEVKFVINTKSINDLKWLRSLADKTEEYTYFEAPECDREQWGCIWDHIQDDNTMYIKLDDDILYIHPDAIPRLVHSRIEHKEPFAVSANIVNTMLMGYLHYHTEALHAFFPEPNDKPTWPAAESWRPSELPKHLGANDIPGKYSILDMSPAFKGQRWLLLGDNSPLNMLQTPLGRFEPNQQVVPFGDGLRSYAQGAQQHYSLLKNLEDNTLSRYHFGSNLKNSNPGVSDTMWDTKYQRYNLNFMAIWGHDVRAQSPIPKDDEQAITQDIPRQTGRPFVIETRAVVAHYSFKPQLEKMLDTDLVDRYRAFANEQVCDAGNLKRPFGKRCDGFWADAES